VPPRNNDCYLPVNYDGSYHGPITLRNALAQSVNIPAIKTLYLAGIKESLATARDMGISTLSSANRYGLTLVLGGGEVTLVELSSAYGVFAQDGIYHKPAIIEKIEKPDGSILEEYTAEPRRALDENIARTINDILSDNVARTPSFGANSPLYFPNHQVAAKTGTTNDYRDMWVVGYTPNLVLGAWVGNNDNSSMEKKVAGFVVAPMWHKLMESYLAKQGQTGFNRPTYTHLDNKSVKPILRGIWQGGVTYEVDTVSGKLATENTPRELIEERAATDIHSILHWVNKTDPMGETPSRPESDPQYVFWETAIRKWLAKNVLFAPGANTIPTTYDDIHTPEQAPKITMVSPQNGSRFSKTQTITISFTVNSQGFPVDEAEYYVGDTYLGKTKYPLVSFSFLPDESMLGQKTIVVKVYDTKRNMGQANVNLEIIP
jgi:membrane peptidoglycan carboxypeptidase